MKAYRHLIKHGLRQGFSFSVFTGGDGPDLSRSTSFKAITEAVEAVDEASLRIRDQGGKVLANVFVIPFGLEPDETVADWSAASDAASEWLDAWSNAYDDHQNRRARLMA